MERRNGGGEAAMRRTHFIPAQARVALFLGLSACVCAAQDRRKVVEPTIPPACVTLHAELTLHEGKLEAEDENKLDTERLQHALAGCAQGKAVELATNGAKNAFLTGPLQVPPDVTLLVDGGVTIEASRDPRLYDLQPGSCGLVNNAPAGCKPVISVLNAAGAAVMGDGVIDGRGAETLLHQPITWWDLAEKARSGGRQQVPRLIVADHSNDFTLYRITLRNSPNFHVVFSHGHGFTVWNLKIDTPQHARNTDGVDPGSSEDITVTRSFIRTGDDNIAIKGSEDGVGYMTVEDNHFYYGHGMSIGSETYGGVHDILVKHLSLDGPDNAIRIKSNSSRGGLVERVTYSDVCIRNSKWPILMQTDYNNPGPFSNRVPVYRDIHLENVRILGGGTVSVEGLDVQHRLSVSLDGVLLDDPQQYRLSVAHAAITYGPGPVNFILKGDDVTAFGTPAKGTLAPCSAMFVPFEVLK
jgi:polygalacturonase